MSFVRLLNDENEGKDAYDTQINAPNNDNQINALNKAYDNQIIALNNESWINAFHNAYDTQINAFPLKPDTALFYHLLIVPVVTIVVTVVVVIVVAFTITMMDEICAARIPGGFHLPTRERNTRLLFVPCSDGFHLHTPRQYRTDGSHCNAL